MKKQIFTNTILYTHNTLVPVTKQDSSVNNQFGKFLKNNYKYNIIWVPQNPNGDTREIRIMPQYKFGHSDDPSSSFVDALSNPVSHNVSAQPSFTTSTLNSMANKTTFTDNIVLKLHSAVTNNALTINSSLSNYSSFLANIPHNISYNMAFRLVISIYNVTTNTTEHTIYSYITNVRFGRSPIQKPGTPPDLIWDRKPDLTRYPFISTEPDPVTLFEGQNFPLISCNCLGANASLLAYSDLPVIFDGKSFNFGTNQRYGPYDAGDASARFYWMENPRYSEYWDYTFDTFYGNHVFTYKKYQTGFETPQDTVLQKIINVYKTEEGSVPNIICSWRAGITITAQGLDPYDYCVKDIIAKFSCKDTCESFKVNNGYTAQDVVALPFGSPSDILLVNYDDVGSNFGGSCELPIISIGSQVCN